MGFVDGKERHISDYEWAGACKYLVWVSTQMGIKEVNSDAVYSFGLSKYGPKKLIERKEKTEKLLEENILAIEEWVQGHKGILEEYERDLIRGLWRTMVGAKAIVTEHINRVKALAKVIPMELEYVDNADCVLISDCNDDDIPF